MTYYVRLMQLSDIGQVTEIDREAFSTQWPPPNYRRELQNGISHHVVAIDEEIQSSGDGPQTAVEAGPQGIATKIKQWLGWRCFQKVPCQKEFVVGFAGLWIIAGEAHITSIAVREKYRGQRVGELLLLALGEVATGLKARSMTLEVRVSNKIAQSLYSKYGFTQVGLRRGYYTDNREDAVLMSTEDISSRAFQAHFAQLKSDYLRTNKQIFRENILNGKR